MVVGDSLQNYLYRFESDTGVYNLGRWMSGLVSGLQNQPRLFEPGTALKFGPVAQLVEHQIEDLGVGSSILPRSTCMSSLE